MHFKKISNFHVFCAQTYAKCRFWANFVPTCEYKTSPDLATDGPIFANLVSKDAQDLKEKSREKACRDLRRSRGSHRFRAGGGEIPPPPVKIGLIDDLTHSERRPQNIYSQEEINLYFIIKLATQISLFSLQISKT